jgi:ATP-dependent exoDNAse (exonuclease V) beta subunit
MAKLLIYRASAGSGKTHTLVTNYIKWALQYPDAFKHILAVTFTNRATQEMKQRIIVYLYSLSIGEKTVLQEELCQSGWNLLSLQERSKKVLSIILHQYGDFSVTTIDSFFHKIVQSFTKELGLKQNFSIEMDQELALQETVEEMVTKLSHTPLLQKWIIDFALHKLLVGKTWNVKKDIQNLGKTLFDESFKLYEKTLLTAFQREEALPQFFAEMKILLVEFEQKMGEIGQSALATLEQNELDPEDFAYGSKGVLGYFFKIANKKDFEPTKRALIGRDNLKSWRNKKANPKEATIQRVIATSLHPLLMDGITLYEQEGQRYRTGVVASRLIYTFGIIGALLIGLSEYRSKHNVLFISDIATLLYQIIQENETPFLYEKIGNQFHHFLVDEFQDLSLFQWMNIKPLLRNSLAQGYANLLVGDVKQSIYRWRGSNWKLLNHQVEVEFKESNLHTLTTNRRSQETIVLFNNHFFSTASNYLVHYLQSELTALDESTLVELLQSEVAQIGRAYGDVVQQVMPVTGGRKGYVELLFLPADQVDEEDVSTSWKMRAQKEVITLIEQLQKEGIQAKDIVLLIRNNSEAALVASLFSTQSKDNHATEQYEIISDHSRSLWSHAAIKLLIYALYYLNNENDYIHKVAFIQVYYSCIAKQQVVFHNYEIDGSTEETGDIENLLPKPFLTQKDFLKNVSIYTCVEQLIVLLFENNHNHSDILSFFQSTILDFFYKKEEGESIQAFLTWWEKRGKNIKLPATNKEHTIRVMTIHQSKGLEFKVVIMPFCSWNLDHAPQKSPTLWSASNQQAPFNHFPVLPLDYGVDLKETHYAKDYHLERIQIHLDNLNLLYVAFTRAEERLYIIAPLPAKRENMATTADLIYQSFVTSKATHANEYSTTQKLVVNMQETPTSTKFWFG